MNTTPSVEGLLREAREYERIPLHIPGKLFDPAAEATVECNVVNLSPGGAGVHCQTQFRQGMELILHIDVFGRFEGIVVSHYRDAVENDARFGLAFALGESKRKKVADMISLFVRDGLEGVTELRKSRRVRTNGIVDLVLGDGKKIACEMVDISLEGVALRTNIRPPLGELVSLGRTQGQVARYHDEGIAIRFVRPISNELALTK
jgi:hypothetical protein